MEIRDFCLFVKRGQTCDKRLHSLSIYLSPAVSRKRAAPCEQTVVIAMPERTIACNIPDSIATMRRQSAAASTVPAWWSGGCWQGSRNHMRWKPSGSVCKWKRRMNSPAARVITLGLSGYR